jgi:hypothetical protein
MPFDRSMLAEGDHLIYGKKDLFGWITSVKTWSPAVHIEVYIGNGQSAASRNGLGVNIYPVRPEQLIAVLEPKQSINVHKSLAWLSEPYDPDHHTGVRGRPYGWKQLLRFYNIHLKTDGWICSEFVDYFDNAGDFFPFAEQFDSGAIDPGDYLISPSFNWKWVDPKTLEKIREF